jgi:hypothetical protein
MPSRAVATAARGGEGRTTVLGHEVGQEAAMLSSAVQTAAVAGGNCNLTRNSDAKQRCTNSSSARRRATALGQEVAMPNRAIATGPFMG